MIAADLGNPDAVELLRLMFESSSSEYVRMFIAFNLIRSNDHGCLHDLEAKLDEVGTDTRAFVGRSLLLGHTVEFKQLRQFCTRATSRNG